METDFLSAKFNPGNEYLIGRILNGRYLIQRALNISSVFKTYIARDQETGDNTLIKEWCLSDAEGVAQARRFETEVSALKRLQHNNIERLVDHFSQHGRLFVATDYLPGLPLKELITVDGSLPVEMAFPVFEEVLQGLGHAHESGVIHGNVSPESIVLLAESGGKELAQLTDFSCATLRGETLNPQQHYHGSILPSYWSPEHLTGERIDERTDIYCLGIVMYETLTGKLPFGADKIEEVAKRQLTALPPRFRSTESGHSIPFEVEAIVLGCLSKRPQDRYQSTEELLEALLSFEFKTKRPQGALNELKQAATPREKVVALYTPRTVPEPAQSVMQTATVLSEPRIDHFVPPAPAPQEVPAAVVPAVELPKPKWVPTAGPSTTSARKSARNSVWLRLMQAVAALLILSLTGWAFTHTKHTQNFDRKATIAARPTSSTFSTDIILAPQAPVPAPSFKAVTETPRVKAPPMRKRRYSTHGYSPEPSRRRAYQTSYMVMGY